MTDVIEKRLKRLEMRLEQLEKVLLNNLACPDCGFLLTIHEEYQNVKYEGGSHAQCYHCGTAIPVKEPGDDPNKWKWKRKSIRL